MRYLVLVFIAFLAASLIFAGCGDKPIGQPCDFSWPKKKDPNDPLGENKIPDCDAFPACHPLQDTAQGLQLNNDACPVDCIQMPSLECENLICVATQIEGNATNINGRCGSDVASECQGVPFGCMGYCTKECLTDASCPKGYSCSAMAPFGQTLDCTNDDLWGTDCTENCIKAGESPPEYPGNVCMSSAGDNVDFSDCDLKEFSKCCACICYQFCPILTKKFCRKEGWDKDLFPDAITNASGCGQD